jgi:hypothetical protein
MAGGVAGDGMSALKAGTPMQGVSVESRPPLSLCPRCSVVARARPNGNHATPTADYRCYPSRLRQKQAGGGEVPRDDDRSIHVGFVDLAHRAGAVGDLQVELVPVGALQQAGHDLITERPVLGRLAAGHLTTAILINDRNREVLQVLGRVEEGTRIARRK